MFLIVVWVLVSLHDTMISKYLKITYKHYFFKILKQVARRYGCTSRATGFKLQSSIRAKQLLCQEILNNRSCKVDGVTPTCLEEQTKNVFISPIVLNYRTIGLLTSYSKSRAHNCASLAHNMASLGKVRHCHRNHSEGLIIVKGNMYFFNLLCPYFIHFYDIHLIIYLRINARALEPRT